MGEQAACMVVSPLRQCPRCGSTSEAIALICLFLFTETLVLR